MSDHYEQMLAFDTDDPEFARGFEAGRLWVLLELDIGLLKEQPFHASNAEMVMRMVEAFGMDLRAEFTDDETWMVLR